MLDFPVCCMFFLVFQAEMLSDRTEVEYCVDRHLEIMRGHPATAFSPQVQMRKLICTLTTMGWTQVVVKGSKDASNKWGLLAYWEDLNVLALKDLCGKNIQMNVPSSQINRNTYILTLWSQDISTNCQLLCVTNQSFNTHFGTDAFSMVLDREWDVYFSLLFWKTL